MSFFLKKKIDIYKHTKRKKLHTHYRSRYSLSLSSALFAHAQTRTHAREEDRVLFFSSAVLCSFRVAFKSGFFFFFKNEEGNWNFSLVFGNFRILW